MKGSTENVICRSLTQRERRALMANGLFPRYVEMVYAHPDRRFRLPLVELLQFLAGQVPHG